jgi:mRNA interferase YafQ
MRIVESNAFKKDLKRYKNQPSRTQKLEMIVLSLARRQTLAAKHRDHLLAGNWKGFRECHIEPDFLLIYRIKDEQLELARLGSHASLF